MRLSRIEVRLYIKDIVTNLIRQSLLKTLQIIMEYNKLYFSNVMFSVSKTF